jgi:dimethylargininase
MFSRFTQAIVRRPTYNFADGLTTAEMGIPGVDLALQQHTAYCAALVRNGCTVTELPEDERFPDGTFVEDTALILPGIGAILTRPGAESRAGEVDAIGEVLSVHFDELARITAPGTLDAGDVCEAGSHVFIGLSVRTNEEGARQLAAWLSGHGLVPITVDIRDTPGILHLKSGVTALDERRLLAIDGLGTHAAFRDYDVVIVPKGEEYAANAVRVNDVVFVADGYRHTHAMLRGLGYQLEVLEMSEFAKMDGGLSCLSLRF